MIIWYSFAQKLEEEFRYTKDGLGSFLTDFISRHCNKHPSLDEPYIKSLAESTSYYIIDSFNNQECEVSYKSRLEVISLLRKAIKEGFQSPKEILSYVEYEVDDIYMFFIGEDTAIKKSLSYGAYISEGEEWQPPAEEIMNQCKAVVKEMVVELVTKITDYAENSEYAILRRNTEMNRKISSRKASKAKASPEEQSFAEKHPSKKQKTEPPKKLHVSFRDVDS